MKSYDNAPVARLVLQDRRRYGPAGSLMLRWAVLVLAPGLYPEYARCCDEIEALAERRPHWGDWRDGYGGCIGYADWAAESELIIREVLA